MCVGIGIEFKDDGLVIILRDNYIKECIQVYEGQHKSKAARTAKCTWFDDNINTV